MTIIQIKYLHEALTVMTFYEATILLQCKADIENHNFTLLHDVITHENRKQGPNKMTQENRKKF